MYRAYQPQVPAAAPTDFVSFIDKLIAKTSGDQKSVHRDWSELVAARKAAM
jgi:hypothetical protein